MPRDWLAIVALQLIAAVQLSVLVAGQQERTETPLSPQNWTSKFSCPSNEARNLLDSDECQREPTAWRWKYIDELQPAYKFLIKESSVDERFANIIHVSDLNVITLNFLKFAYNTGDSERDLENMRLVAGPQVDEKLCTEQLQQMVDLLEETKLILTELRSRNTSNQLEEQHFRLVRVLDSFGRYQSGALSATTHLIGSYKQCVGSQLLLGTNKTASQTGQLVQTRFCWARHSVDKLLSKPIKDRQQTKVHPHEDGDFKLSAGVCLPVSCHSLSSNKHPNKLLVKRLIDSQLKFPESIYLQEALELDSVYCLVDEQSEYAKIPTSGRCFLAAFLSWLLLLLLATIKTRLQERKAKAATASPILKKLRSQLDGTKKSVWTKLDLVASWNDLFDCGQSQAGQAKVLHPVDLDVLNPIKALICVYIVYAHAIYLTRFCTTQFLDVVAEFETDKLMLLIFASPLLVDTFFVISSILLTYTKLKELTRAESRQIQAAKSKTKLRFVKYWLILSTSRYLRLVPLFVIVFWFKKSVLVYLGNGPLWDSGLNWFTFAGVCVHRASWFHPLNVHPTTMATCLPQAWSVSNELFFGIVLTPFVILMTKSLKLSLTLVIGITVYSLNANLNAFYNLQPPAALWEFRELRSIVINMIGWSEGGSIVITPSYRLGVAFCGLISGFALFKYNESNKNVSEISRCIGGAPTGGYRWPRWFVWPASLVAGSAIVLLIAASAYRQEIKAATFPDYRKLAVPAAVANVLIWSAASAVLLTRLMTDLNDTWLGRICSNKLWNIPRKLCYATLLIHFDVILYQLLSADSIQHATKWSAFSLFASTLMIATPISIFAYVCIERPLDVLLRSYLHL